MAVKGPVLEMCIAIDSPEKIQATQPRTHKTYVDVHMFGTSIGELSIQLNVAWSSVQALVWKVQQ